MTTSHRAWRAYASCVGGAPARHALPISTTSMDANPAEAAQECQPATATVSRAGSAKPKRARGSGSVRVGGREAGLGGLGSCGAGDAVTRPG